MIEFKNVTKFFQKKIAVDGVSFTAVEGDSIVIAGPSGCGKTTLLRLIAGLETPDAGEIILNGRPANGLAPHKRGVAMVFQDMALWPHMSVLQNVVFCSGSRQMSEKILLEVGLGGHLGKYPRQLSGGEQQRLALARGLVTSPRILLLDEPLANIDPMLKDELKDLILRFQRKEKITMLYVTHSREEAVHFSDNLIVMHGGKIEQMGKREELCANPRSEFVRRFLT